MFFVRPTFICLLGVARSLAQDLVDLSEELGEILKQSPVPSLAAAAVLDGKMVSTGAAGLRKAGESVEVSVEDRYHIGSCTKSMTAVLAARLVEAGLLSWNTTLATVFPEVAIHPGFREVTLRQLLSNSGGTPGDIEAGLWKKLWAAEGTAREQRMQLVRGILSQKPAYPAGSRQLYSNAGFAIAGAIIESMIDRPYEDLLRKMLFSPLGMATAGFRAPATNGKIDQPYGHHFVDGQLVPVDPEPRGDNPRAIIPAGGVHCSVIDLARYARFHLGQAETPILAPKSREELHRPEPGRDYALGWMVTERSWADGRTLTHTGSNTMFFAVIWLAPEKNFAAVAMGNCGGEKAFQTCDQAIALLVEKHLPTPPPRED